MQIIKAYFNLYKRGHFFREDEVAEWLRRLPAKQLCSAREGSNPFLVDFFIFSMIITSFP